MNGVGHMENTKESNLLTISRISSELCVEARREVPDIAIYGINEAVPFCLQEIGRKNVEHILVLYLSTSSHLTAYSIASIGTESQCCYSISEVIRCAILCNATQLLLAHNHPSGNLVPSYDDLKATRQLAQAASLFHIKLIDSIIVSPTGDSYSMRKSLNEKG